MYKGVRDRFDELQSKANYNGNTANDAQIDIDLNKNTDFSVTLKKYEQIAEWIAIVQENTEDMKKLTSEISKAFYNPKNFSGSMSAKREQNISYYNKIVTILKELENDLPTEDDCSTLARMKYGLYHGNRERIYRVWQEYSSFLVSYEERFKKIIRRQAEIANHTITEDETETLLESNAAFFTGNILQETQTMQDNLKELVERYQELQKLEKSLQEVREMFVYMGQLVMQQGEVIQSIEFHALRAVDNVDLGTNQLEKAHELKIKSLKKKTCILIWVAIVLIVIIAILVLY